MDLALAAAAAAASTHLYSEPGGAVLFIPTVSPPQAGAGSDATSRRRSMGLGKNKLPAHLKYIDKCRIVAEGGHGGRGCVSFYRSRASSAP
jgi:hypothetical protein